MLQFIAVVAGGAIGAVLRYAVSALSLRWYQGQFPLGTLLANLVGCATIGIAWAGSLSTTFPPTTTAFLFVGLLGAFTTFSTYGLESVNLLINNRFRLAALYFVGSNLAGFTFVYLGLQLGRLLLA